MSHFAVVVLLDGRKTVDGLMAPYEEQWAADDAYTEFEEVIGLENRWENEHVRCFRTPEGLVPSHKVRNWSLDGEETEYQAFVKKYGNPVEVPVSELCGSFEDFAGGYCGYVQNDFGKWGLWLNPNSKWDYWQETPPHKAWRGEFVDRHPTACEVEGWESKSPKELRELYPKLMASAAGENVPDLSIYDSTAYGDAAEAAADVDEFAETMCIWHPYALVTPDGRWHSPGEVGWWGTTSENGREALEWVGEFQRLMKEHGDCIVAVLDCHV